MVKIRHISYVKSGLERYGKTKIFDGKVYTKKEEFKHNRRTAFLASQDWREAGLNARVDTDQNNSVYIRNRKR